MIQRKPIVGDLIERDAPGRGWTFAGRVTEVSGPVVHLETLTIPPRHDCFLYRFSIGRHVEYNRRHRIYNCDTPSVT